MIISRTPFRISFFGGGTDYPSWYREHGGKVLTTSIDKYCYITCRYLPPFFEHRHRIVYSLIENVKDVSEIQHPSVRAVLEFMKIEKGIEIHHDGDLPARTGTGSSSSFTVGLLHALYALKGLMPTKQQLAKESIHIEQNILQENVGSQDQVEAAFGGLNIIHFNRDNGFRLEPIILKKERLKLFQDHLMLFFTGVSRYASKIAKEQIQNIPQKKRELKQMQAIVDEALLILTGKDDICAIGRLLHESWKIKRSLSSSVSTTLVDEIYESALRYGADGGKLLGAGGGGFVLIFAKPGVQPRIREGLEKLQYVPFRFSKMGSEIIFYTS